MNKMTQRDEKTRALLLRHGFAYPILQTEDIFKYLFQSAFGCEHLVSSDGAALDSIGREYGTVSTKTAPRLDRLDGEYSRVHLSWLNGGLSSETLARLFCLSAKKEQGGKALLEEKLRVAKELVADGLLPPSCTDFETALDEWRAMDYPALHHSDAFRAAYRPAYRVIANRYADVLPLLAKIDGLLAQGGAVVAIEGGSASGKTTLAGILEEVYDCNIFHMDDFFLRPAQRTQQRLDEVGGNVDRERFYEEVLQPLKKRETVCYRPFDCRTQALEAPITVAPKRLTVVEGVYSMHPAFDVYYDLSVFLDMDAEVQRARILKRNAPPLAKRFFEEWIPLENRYFSQMQIKSRCSEIIRVVE